MMADRRLRDGWRWARFGDVVREVRTATKDPEADGLSRVVGLEHLDSELLPLRRWNELVDLGDGTSFTRVFRAGQVLFGKRRAYQRKVAVPDFDGICSSDILVLEPSTDELLRAFLPYLVQSDGFFDHALGTSAGSLSPRTKFQELAKYEFPLPPVDEQSRLAADVGALDQAIAELARVADASDWLREATSHALFANADSIPRTHLTELVSRPIQYGVLKPGPEYPGGVRCVDVKDYPEGEIEVTSVRSIDPAIEREFRRSKLSAGDLLVSVRGTIGRVAKVPAELEGANISRDSARVSLREGVDPEYVRVVLEGADAQREMRGKVVGLAVKGINIADLRLVSIPLPSLEAQRSIARQSESIRSVKAVAARDAADLRRLRGGLLARLLKGASR